MKSCFPIAIKCPCLEKIQRQAKAIMKKVNCMLCVDICVNFHEAGTIVRSQKAVGSVPSRDAQLSLSSVQISELVRAFELVLVQKF